MIEICCGASECTETKTLMECPLCKLWVCTKHYEHNENKRGIQAHE
ncbi:MAG: hypothetical protein GTN97_07120 [Nitrosopumilaceae archaeon]|nr:hypothetical protein [Nitrosopumilaceae archaeon]